MNSIIESTFEYAQFLLENVVTIMIVLGPLIGYISQYRLIAKNNAMGSFSVDVCLILLFANILRIYFWFGKHFEISLLLQSVLMIIMQFALLKKCIDIKRNQLPKSKQLNVTFQDQPILMFWRWSDFQSYVQAVTSFCISLTIACYIMSENISYWELVGISSALIEASLGLPQMLQNFRSKSTAGLSYVMIFSWISGDVFKTVYFVIKDSPKQFLLCGVTQIIVDLIIIGQISFYKEQYLEL